MILINKSDTNNNILNSNNYLLLSNTNGDLFLKNSNNEYKLFGTKKVYSDLNSKVILPCHESLSNDDINKCVVINNGIIELPTYNPYIKPTPTIIKSKIIDDFSDYINATKSTIKLELIDNATDSDSIKIHNINYNNLYVDGTVFNFSSISSGDSYIQIGDNISETLDNISDKLISKYDHLTITKYSNYLLINVNKYSIYTEMLGGFIIGSDNIIIENNYKFDTSIEILMSFREINIGYISMLSNLFSKNYNVDLNSFMFWITFSKKYINNSNSYVLDIYKFPSDFIELRDFIRSFSNNNIIFDLELDENNSLYILMSIYSPDDSITFSMNYPYDYEIIQNYEEGILPILEQTIIGTIDSIQNGYAVVNTNIVKAISKDFIEWENINDISRVLIPDYENRGYVITMEKYIKEFGVSLSAIDIINIFKIFKTSYLIMYDKNNEIDEPMNASMENDSLLQLIIGIMINTPF